MRGMLISRLDGGRAIIDLLGLRTACDAIVFDSGEAALVGRGQAGSHISQIEIEADVAVKIAVARVAGVAFVATPDLAGGIAVAAKSGHAFRREDRIARLRVGVENAVGVSNEPTDVGLLEHLLEAFGVGALGQPDTARVAAKTRAVMIASDEDLCANGRRMGGQEREQSMGRGAGDDFQLAGLLELSKPSDKVAAASQVSVANPAQPVAVEQRQLLESVL